ncbi:MAG: hypothetical protein WBF81_06295 [Thermoplasmata archaeon]
MIVEFVGYWFRALSHLRPGDAGRDLDHLGAELMRLARRRR